ncbi:hypothetical protein ZIOFF_026973 [Zingiber officinale]|uniref:Uncharacterized protein n=1 Tax=Zingiber officinale TaxID=94328 RepID=A0A8J5H4Q1_ZINOF|nr:hypothetical protein ZIOFF_026973 [Zingiber officinale]
MKFLFGEAPRSGLEVPRSALEIDYSVLKRCLVRYLDLLIGEDALHLLDTAGGGAEENAVDPLIRIAKLIACIMLGELLASWNIRSRSPSPSPRWRKSRSPSPQRRASRSPLPRRHKRQRSRSILNSPIHKSESPSLDLHERQRLEEEKKR